LAANHEEGGRGLSLGEDGQDLLGAMRPGAIVEGERHRQRPCGAGRGVEGNRHRAASSWVTRTTGSIRCGRGQR
jgi:hypothetical protein